MSPYSRSAIILHWLIAFFMVGNLVGGLFLEDLFNSSDPAQRQLGFTVVQVHKSGGLTVLALTLLRIFIRVREGFPALPDHMTPIERTLARVTHFGFYALMLALPLSGWLMVSASPLGFPTLWFGLFEVPHLPVETSKANSEAAGEVHEILGYIGLGLLALHIAGALKHHLFDRDDVLARMIPFARRKA